MTNYLNTFLKDIEDRDIVNLLDELVKVTKVQHEPFKNRIFLIHYLQLCVRPNGADTEQVLIDNAKLDSAGDYTNSFMLRKKIKDVADTQLYWLFDELARVYKKQSIEPDLRKTIYIFLNECLKEPKRKKKKKPFNYTWR